MYRANQTIVVNIWSGTNKLIKVVLRQERILVLGFRTTLMNGFDPLQMLISVEAQSTCLTRKNQ